MPSTCGSEEGGLLFDPGSRVWAGENRSAPSNVVLLYLRSGSAQAGETPERIIRMSMIGSIALLVLATKVINRAIDVQTKETSSGEMKIQVCKIEKFQ